MAKHTDTSVYKGTDFSWPLDVRNEAETVSLDITGWAISWMLKRRPVDEDADALLVKAPLSITGAWNAAPLTNTQRATVTLTDTETGAFAPGPYHYEFKRTDDGFETLLAYGLFTVKRPVHR